MFRMTADIKFEGYKAVKPSSLTWDRSVDNYSDHATIVIPAMCRMIDQGTRYDHVITGQAIPEGSKVEIHAGYDGKNDLRFKGFVKRINFKVPLEIECEGYAYQLRSRMFSKSYLNTTVKKILEDITQGTDIKLSAAIPHIPIPKVWFKNYTGLQVLEYLKEKCLLTVYFNLDVLYCGLRATEPKDPVKFRLNWNVISDDSLLFNADKEFATVNIRVEKRGKTGSRKKGAAPVVKPGNVKVKRVALIEDENALAEIAAEEKKKMNNRGYTGKITAFMHPYAEPGMSAEIIDKTYTERNGRYFIESVSGSFGTNGGRQKIGIGFSL